MRATTTTTTARMLSRPRCRRESPAALPVPRRLCTLRLVARESPAALPGLRRLAPSIPVLASPWTQPASPCHVRVGLVSRPRLARAASMSGWPVVCSKFCLESYRLRERRTAMCSQRMTARVQFWHLPPIWPPLLRNMRPTKSQILGGSSPKTIQS